MPLGRRCDALRLRKGQDLQFSSWVDMFRVPVARMSRPEVYRQHHEMILARNGREYALPVQMCLPLVRDRRYDRLSGPLTARLRRRR